MGKGGHDGTGVTVPLLQSPWWRTVKESFGWKAIWREPLILQRPVGPFRLAYAPHAFDDEGATLAQVVETLGTAGAASKATLVRWDVPWRRERFPEAAAHETGLVPSVMRVQPPDTVLLPLADGEEAILAAMKRKTRYNIGLAGRKGVTLSTMTGREIGTVLPEWYRLYLETARRDGITVHSRGYYETVVSAALGLESEDAPQLELLFARHEGELLGGIMTASWNGVTTYLYGASSSHKRNLMASYALQWEAITRAIGRGDHSYDFFGIPPTDDPAHPMHGLYRFKTGFGGMILHRAGAWDIPMRRPGADLYRQAERLRKWYHFSLKKRFRSGGA